IEYATASNLALAAWEANDVGRLRFLLDLMKPRQDEPDLRGWEWHYLNGLAHQDRPLSDGPDREIRQAAFSPDGRTLGSMHKSGRVGLWDVASGRLCFTFQPRPPILDSSPSGVLGLAFSPDGKRLAGPGPDATLGIWDVHTGELIVRFSVNSLETPCVAF